MIKFELARTPLFPHIFCATTKVFGGVSRGNYRTLNLGAHVGDQRVKVDYNRNLLFNCLKAKFQDLQAPIYLKQAHSSMVAPVTEADREKELDGVWTARDNTPLLIMTADCLPIMMSDGDIICAVHAGWKGLSLKIIENAVQLFPKPENIRVWIGPHISQRHFEVGDEVATQFSVYNSVLLPSINPGKFLLSLSKVALQQFKKLGVYQIGISPYCSYANSAFYSHRKSTHYGNKNTGRNVTLIIKSKR